MQDSISRRKFLIAGAPLVAVLGPGTVFADPVWARSRRRTYFVLNPKHGTGPRCRAKDRKKPRDCQGCNACQSHAKNKLFATARAAERAHKGCKCRVVKGGTLDADLWAELFGGRKHPKRPVADRRSKRVKKILRRARRRELAAARS